MKILVKMKFGSHLYGTATAVSDLDIKGIYIPDARDILLQCVLPVVSENKIKLFGKKNSADDVDYDLYSPQKYLTLLAHGQSVALEMLFAPESALLEKPHPAWEKIKSIAPHILTKKAASFVHYCRQQAHKYGAKGARIAAARLALEVLTALEKKQGPSASLSSGYDLLKELAEKNEFLVLGSTTLAQGGKALYFEICGKKALLDASIKSARLIAEKIIDEYGERALAAESNEGIDWKALSHAVRVGHQAIEFLRSHRMTFPRPEAEHLIAIKQGSVSFQKVIEEIDQLLLDVEMAAQQSDLPENFDQKIIDDFIVQLYVQEVLQSQKE